MRGGKRETPPGEGWHSDGNATLAGPKFETTASLQLGPCHTRLPANAGEFTRREWNALRYEIGMLSLGVNGNALPQCEWDVDGCEWDVNGMPTRGLGQPA